MFHTYVLYSEKFDRIYIGQTQNYKKRILKHNSGSVKSTKSFVPWKITHVESFTSRGEALKREQQLKSHAGRDCIRREVLLQNV